MYFSNHVLGGYTLRGESTLSVMQNVKVEIESTEASFSYAKISNYKKKKNLIFLTLRSYRCVFMIKNTNLF